MQIQTLGVMLAVLQVGPDKIKVLSGKIFALVRARVLCSEDTGLLILAEVEALKVIVLVIPTF